MMANLCLHLAWKMYNDYLIGMGELMATTYVVFEDGKEIALVRARSKSAAILFITTPKYEAVLADGDAMHKLGKQGMEIQDADKAGE